MTSNDYARAYRATMPHSIWGSGGRTPHLDAEDAVLEPGFAFWGDIAHSTLRGRDPNQCNPPRGDLPLVEAKATAETVRLSQLLELAAGDNDAAETARANLWSEFGIEYGCPSFKDQEENA